MAISILEMSFVGLTSVRSLPLWDASTEKWLYTFSLHHHKHARRLGSSLEPAIINGG